MDIYHPSTPLSLLALPAAWLYGLAMRSRAVLYRRGVLSAHALEVPVIAVGNLTVGGTGKTPVVAAVAEFLARRGRRPAVLSRGYGGSGQGDGVIVVSDGKQIHAGPDLAGDEPFLLAHKLPGIPVVCHPRRSVAGRWVEQHLDVDVLVLDDAFQHLGVDRDVNLLLLDAAAPVGNGRILPAGPLREPIGAAARADVVLVTRCPAEEPKVELPRRLTRALEGVPLFTSTFRPTRLMGAGGEPAGELAEFGGQRVMAFCGIGRPGQFFSMLEAAGLNLVERVVFTDHQHYGPSQLEQLLEVRRRSGAEVALTTEKDIVKLGEFSPGCPVLAVDITLEPHQPQFLEFILERISAAGGQ